MELATIQDALTKAPYGSTTPILTPSEAAIRAHLIIEHMSKVGIDIVVETFPCGNVAVPYYQVPRSDFGMEDDGEVHDSLTGHGTGLNWGDLVRLSKACMIGERFLQKLWPMGFKDKLINDHNACIQEVLWLSRFKHPTKVEAEPRPFPPSKKGPDWRFSSSSQRINLEVKFRPGDWIRRVDSEKFAPARLGIFDSIATKFSRKNADELNFGAVTLMGPISESVASAAERFIHDEPTVDAVFLWSESPEDGPDTLTCPNNAFFKNFFNEGDEEDRCHIGVIRHIWRKSDERRNANPGEFPEIPTVQ